MPVAMIFLSLSKNLQHSIHSANVSIIYSDLLSKSITTKLNILKIFLIFL